MFMLGSKESYSSDAHVSGPADFDEYLAWVCTNFHIDISITKKQQEPYEPIKAKGKKKTSHYSEEDKEMKSSSLHGETEAAEEDERKVHMITKYIGEDLVHILIEKTKHIPRQLFAIINLIVEHLSSLQGITISSGLDQYTIYELSKIIPISNITEVYLDDNFVKNANYDILLNNISRLQVLSLARCKIGDRCVNNIAEKLHYPSPASQTLCVLNLSSNRLTDASCKHLAEALRTNRKLSFLNMASNMITDDGGLEILKVLMQFPLTINEILAYKQRYVEFLKKRHDLVKQYESDFKSYVLKNKGKLTKVQPIQVLAKKGFGGNVNVSDFDYDKAYEQATKSTGEFVDPLTDCTSIDGIRYCNGNNNIVALNLAYNSLTYVFLRSLTRVVQYQYSPERYVTKGLLNVRLEGNPMPISCMDFKILESYFNMGITSSTKNPSSKKLAARFPNKK